MSSTAKIVLTPNPKGHFIEVQLASGQTPKPGQHITMKSDGNWEVFNGDADGDTEERVVLIEDFLQGKTAADAYADGARAQAYIPLPGDVINILFKNVAGTADDVVVGDKMIIDDGTGKAIVTTGSPEQEWYKALEAITDPTADTLLKVRTLP